MTVVCSGEGKLTTYRELMNYLSSLPESPSLDVPFIATKGIKSNDDVSALINFTIDQTGPLIVVKSN